MLAPVFQPKYAEFASANQDAIRLAMIRATPPQFRPIAATPANHNKGGKLKAGSVSQQVLRSVAVGVNFTARDVMAKTGLSYDQVRCALTEHCRYRRVERIVRACGNRQAIYQRAV